MKKLSTYLFIFFAILFWVFRIVVALTSSLGNDMGFEIPNMNLEIVLLFFSVLCIVLLIKRKMIGGIFYLLSYGLYFGPVLVGCISSLINRTLNFESYPNFLVAMVGIILPICNVFDLLLDQNRKNNPKDKKTDWFYKNKEFDRKLDKRADKNNYRTM